MEQEYEYLSVLSCPLRQCLLYLRPCPSHTQGSETPVWRRVSLQLYFLRKGTWGGGSLLSGPQPQDTYPSMLPEILIWTLSM